MQRPFVGKEATFSQGAISDFYSMFKVILIGGYIMLTGDHLMLIGD